MKNKQLPILILITAIFVSFALGFFLGRNVNHTPVQLSVPVTEATEAPLTQPAAEPAKTAENSGETTAPSDSGSDPDDVSADGPVNINTASQEELMTLPGIGEVLAQRIIDYREDNGPFASVEELTNVSGIGEKRLTSIIDLITAG